MKNKTLILIIPFLWLLASCHVDLTKDQVEAISLAGRVIPEYCQNFEFEQLEDTSDVFELESVGKKIVVRGNNANSMAVGLNFYLKNYCHTTVSWYDYNPVDMPDVLPLVREKIRVPALVDNRFFLNYCTFGYTMPWWGWEQWEHFIDWMALNGINMPLAITGQEAVWQKVWKKYGLTDEQIRTFFVGPAHLPWQRMCNVDRWNGPLPQEWIDSQVDLQKKIVERERSLNMKPILPAFAGHIPAELADVVPGIDTSRVSYWGGFANEYRCTFLSPTDSLYDEIQKEFMRMEIEMFGTDHIYGVDPFNEIDSPSWDPETLAKMSRGIYDSMAAVDKDAIWLQMGWLFYADPTHWTQDNIQSFLKAVPQDKLIMLDYYCEYTQIWEQTDKFFGQPYIWCYLGNFGGNTQLSGPFGLVSDRLSQSLRDGGDNLVGVGSTLEGFGVNQFMYEYILDRAWKSGISDEQWLDNLADRHFGASSYSFRKAWKLMADNIYTVHSRTGNSALVNAHPCLEGHWHWTTTYNTNYSIRDIWEVWELLMKEESDSDNYRFDIVNVGRQVLSDWFMTERDKYTEAYKKGDRDEMTVHKNHMLELLDDLDELLSSRREFSLEDWIISAREYGKGEKCLQDYYEGNARTLISVWGDSYHLTDYANRSLSGMTSSYYKVRWMMFFDEVENAMNSGKEFNQKEFDCKIREFECDWAKPGHEIEYPDKRNEVEICRELFEKYSELIPYWN